MVRCSARWIGAALLAATALAGCGSSDRGPSASTTEPARRAVEHGLLSSVRTAPGVGSVTAVHCAARGSDGRRWTCHLAGTRPQDVAVTVNSDGWWSASDVKAAAAPQMGPDGSQTGDFTAGGALMGCCVPRP